MSTATPPTPEEEEDPWLKEPLTPEEEEAIRKAEEGPAEPW